MNNAILKTFTLLLFLVVSITALAQKLPKVQEASLRIPANTKIDGKSSEWNNKFQAYNNKLQIFYTIANDDDKLYLIIQATDPLVTRKIIAGGVTFTVNSSSNEKDKGVAITYPLFNAKNWPAINLRNKPEITKDSAMNNRQIDSFVYTINKQIQDKSKEIKVFGVKDIDTTISIYNEEGIRAVSLFNHQLAYTYELAIPLKYLGLSGNSPITFNYNIKLNGSNQIEGAVLTKIEGGIRTDWPNGGERPVIGDVFYIYYPIDFSGKYTLAK